MLGKIIRKKRRSLDLSQYELAKKIGKTTRSYISGIERCCDYPSLKTLASLCEVLNLNYNILSLKLKKEKLIRYKQRKGLI